MPTNERKKALFLSQPDKEILATPPIKPIRKPRVKKEVVTTPLATISTAPVIATTCCKSI